MQRYTRRMARKPRQPAKPLDPFRIFKHATAFELATFTLAKGFKQGNEAFRVPFIVNSAFSAELYFKCLLHLEQRGDKADGHELHKLYQSFTKPHKQRIEVMFQQGMQTNPVMANIFAHESSGDLPKLSWGIDDILKRCNLAFPKWRFSYELAKNEMVYAGIQPIRDAVRSLILELQPTWPKDRDTVIS